MFFETLWRDVSYGGRMLWQKPAYSAIAILTIALGIGANTAIFSVVNTVLLKPLPFDEPDRVMALGRKPARIAPPCRNSLSAILPTCGNRAGHSTASPPTTTSTSR